MHSPFRIEYSQNAPLHYYSSANSTYNTINIIVVAMITPKVFELVAHTLN